MNETGHLILEVLIAPPIVGVVSCSDTHADGLYFYFSCSVTLEMQLKLMEGCFKFDHLYF